MVKKVSSGLTDYLIKKGVIENEVYDIYQFGIENTILKIIHLVSYIILGAIFGLLPELIIFLIVFIPLREYSGGYHAKTPLKCYIVSCFTVFSLLLIIQFTPETLLKYSILLALIGSFVLFLIVPVEAESKPLDDSEKIYYKSKAGFIIILILVLTLFLRTIELYNVSYILALCLIFEMVVAVTGRISLKISSTTKNSIN